MKQIIRLSVVILVLVMALGGLSNPSPAKGSALASGGPTGTVIPGAWRNMRPTESFLRDVSLLDPATNPVDCSSSHKDQRSKGWIVGDSGVILSYCNDIWDQSISTESEPTDLYGVAAVTPTLAFATGVNGTILQYGWDLAASDYTWVKKPIQGVNQVLYRIAVVPNGMLNGYARYTAWAVGTFDPVFNKATLVRGDIYSSGALDDLEHPIYSSSWSNVTSSYNLPAVDLYFGIQAINSNDIWAVGGKSGLGIAIHWNGSTWIPVTIGSDRYYGVHFRSATDGWAVGIGGQIAHYNGSVWTSVSSPVSSSLIDVSFSSDGIGWASGYNGVLLKYVDGKWSQFTDLRTDYWDYYAIDHTSGHGWMIGQNPYVHPSIAYSPGMGGQVLEYSDIDQAWVAVTPPTDNQLNEVKTISDINAWAVGSADTKGATIVHWDGRHWQRWYQNDPPLPMVDLVTIDMLSPTNGWAAGDPLNPGAPAVMLQWDGRRWTPIRYNSPTNVRINSLRLATITDSVLGERDFGWAVASAGNAEAKYDYTNGYWSANHIFQGTYFNLRGLSLTSNYLPSTPNQLTAWAVGHQTLPAGPDYLLQYKYTSGAWYWTPVQVPPDCPIGQKNKNTNLSGIRMVQNLDRSEWGFASGDYDNRASVYQYDGLRWNVVFCQAENIPSNPSHLYSADIVRESGIAWFGGYYNDSVFNRKIAFMAYIDQGGFGWTGNPFPINGRNVYNRPVTSLSMSSDTMGWAVGEKEDTGKVGILYQYLYPNFTLIATPSLQAVRPGSHTNINIGVNSIAAGNMSVALNVLPPPLGITAQISQTPIDPTSTATIRFDIPSGTPIGKYDIEILGSSTIHSGDHDIPVERSAVVTLWVTDHPITTITPDHGPAGSVVTIQGENLGADPGIGNRSTATTHIILAGAQMPDANVLSWSSTEIQVLVPDDVTLFPSGPIKDFVQVTSGEALSNDNLDFQLESRIINTNITNDGTKKTIHISGTSFGNDPGATLRNTNYEHITLDGSLIDYWDVVSWSNNLIEFQVASSMSLGGKKLTIASNGYLSNTVTLTDGNTPGGSGKVFLPVVIQ